MSRICSHCVPRIVLGAAAFAACVASLNAPAHALKLEDFKIEQTGDRPEIRVLFDRPADNWTTVTGANVTFRIGWEITVKASHALAPGSKVSVSLDNVSAEAALQSTNNHYSELHLGTFQLQKPGNALSEVKDRALQTCQTIRSNGGKPNKEHRIPYGFMASAHAYAQTTATWFTDESASANKLAFIDIVCEADPLWHEPYAPPAGGLAVDKGPFQVKSVELFLTTFQNQVTNPTPGTECKKLQVKVRIETNKTGPVTYKLWRQPGSDETKAHLSTFQEDGPFKGRFIAEDTFVHTFDKTTYVQYMAESGSNAPFGVSTQWKDITIHCTSTAGGGLTVGPPQGGGDLIPGFKVKTAQLKIIGIEGKSCPTKAFVAATFTTNKAGKFRYFIGTSVDKNESGELEAKKVGGVFRVQETLTVDITKSGKLLAHTRAVDFPSALAFASRSYNCDGVKPVGGLTAAVDPTHNSGKSRVPQLPKVAPKISCGGGKAKDGKCLCPAGKVPVAAAVNAWRCIGRTAGSTQAKPSR